MPDLEVYTGAHGFDLVINTNLNLETATDIKLRIKSPTGSTVTRVLTVENVDSPASDGIVRYTVANNDFTLTGLYRVQVSDETGGKKVSSDIIKIRCRASLEYVAS